MSGKRRGSSAAMSQLNGGASVSGSAVGANGVSYGKDFEYLLQSQVDEANELSSVALLQLTLTGIAVIDLRSVHTFAPNSPSVNLACGKVVATTTVRIWSKIFLPCLLVGFLAIAVQSHVVSSSVFYCL